jgi:protein-tyrosine-phosphatase
MAAGFMRHLSRGEVNVYSGGSEPVEAVNELVREAMAEKGIDIHAEIPRHWDEASLHAADVVVTLGCADACPVLPGKRYLDWETDDPSGQQLEVIREIRDQIEARVRGLLAELAPVASSD